MSVRGAFSCIRVLLCPLHRVERLRTGPDRGLVVYCGSRWITAAGVPDVSSGIVWSSISPGPRGGSADPRHPNQESLDRVVRNRALLRPISTTYATPPSIWFGWCGCRMTAETGFRVTFGRSIVPAWLLIRSA